MIGKVELSVLGIALALHGGGLGVASLMPKVGYLGKFFTRPMSLEVEVEVEPIKPRLPDQPPVVTETDPGVPRPETASTEQHRRLVPSSPRGIITVEGADGDPDAIPEPGTGPTPTPEDEYGAVELNPELPPGSPPTGISQITQQIAVANSKGEAAPTKTPKAKKADREVANTVIKDELRKKDKNLGLDLPAAGTIASLIKSQVQASDAPATSRASFTVVLGPGGKVKSVTVGGFSAGGAATWEGIARAVKSALAAQKLTLTGDYAKGAVVVVNAESKMQMPSGADVGAGIKLSLTQNFDVADIGAAPVRVVKVSFSSKPAN